MKPPWQPCECCDEFWCNVHGCHVFECECPEIDEWKESPYMAKKKSTRGGERAGAGKKPGVMGKKAVKTIAVSPDIADYMATFTGKDGNPSASAVVEQLIRDSRAFQQWSKKNAAKKKPG